jgi:hypothetical protein
VLHVEIKRWAPWRDRRCIVDGVIATATPEPDTVRRAGCGRRWGVAPQVTEGAPDHLTV